MRDRQARGAVRENTAITGSLGLATHCGMEKVLKASMKALLPFQGEGQGCDVDPRLANAQNCVTLGQNERETGDHVEIICKNNTYDHKYIANV